MQYIIIDSETTGLTDEHEMIALAAIAIDDDLSIISTWESLIKPKKGYLWQEEARILNKEIIPLLAEAPQDIEVVSSFIEWKETISEDKIIPIGHNYAFDQRFLRQLFKYRYDELFHYSYIDTKGFFVLYNLMNGTKFSTSLSSICERLQIPYKEHKALQDCHAVLGLLNFIKIDCLC